MERLNDVIPKLDAGVTPKELLEEEYLKVQVDIIEQQAAVKEPEEEQQPDMQELYAEETVDEVQEPQEEPEEALSLIHIYSLTSAMHDTYGNRSVCHRLCIQARCA